MRPLNGRPTLALGLLLGAAAVASAQSPLREADIQPALTGLDLQGRRDQRHPLCRDRRPHVVAISSDGKILWRKDPFVDAASPIA